MKNLFSATLFFLVLFSTLPAAAQQWPIVTQGELDQYKPTIETLLKDVTGYAATIDESKMQLAERGALHHMMARFYAHTGAPDKALAEVGKVQESLNRIFLLEVHAGLMLEDIAAGRDNKVIERLKTLDQLFAVIRAVKNTDLPSKISNYRYDWMENENHDFCLLAGKDYAARKNYAMLEKIAKLDSCKKSARQLGNYHLDSLLAHGDYVGAFHYIFSHGSPRETYVPKGHSFEHVVIRKGQKEPENAGRAFEFQVNMAECLPRENGAKPESPITSEQLEALKDVISKIKVKGSDAEFSALSRLMVAAGEYAEAEELALKISDEKRKNGSLMHLYEHYFLADDRDATLRIAAQMGLWDDAPLEVGGFGHRDPGQWYNVSVGGVRILSEKPGPLAYKIAMGFKNARTRFTAVRALLTAFEKQKVQRVEGCEGNAFDCMIGEMGKIADAESDETARDYMYAQLVSFYRDNKNPAAADAIKTKIVQPGRTICYYDMCGDLLSGEGPSADFVKNCETRLDAAPDDAIPAFNEYGLRGHPSMAKENGELLYCHYVTKRYKKYLEDPEELGGVRDAYLMEMADWLARERKLDEAMHAIAQMGVAYEGRKAVTRIETFFIHSPFNAVRFKEFLAAVDREPAVRKSYTGWLNILNWLLYTPDGNLSATLMTSDALAEDFSKRLAMGLEVLKERPDVKKAFLQQQPHIVWNLCPLLADSFPAPDAIMRFSPDATQKKKNESYTNCTARLIQAGMYREALYVANVTFNDPAFVFRARTAVLHELLKRENVAYRHSTLDRKQYDFLVDYPFSEDGFVYLQRQQPVRTYTRAYEPNNACPINPGH